MGIYSDTCPSGNYGTYLISPFEHVDPLVNSSKELDSARIRRVKLIKKILSLHFTDYRGFWHSWTRLDQIELTQ